MCARKCDCVECVFSGAADTLSLEEQNATIIIDAPRPLSSNNKKILVAKIKEYRSSICPVDQYGLLFGIEIATGIPDYIIDTILNNLHDCSVDFLVQLGLSHSDSCAINDIESSIGCKKLQRHIGKQHYNVITQSACL